MVDLDSLRITEMPLNSVNYLLINRPQDDPPIFVYNHVLKMQFIVQVFIKMTILWLPSHAFFLYFRYMN